MVALFGEDENAMILEGKNSWLQLSISGYEFPDSQAGCFDSNWLKIRGCANLRGREWAFDDPCLMTFEAMHLAVWLDEVAEGTAQRHSLYFTEPNLEFHRYLTTWIRVVFALEAAPPWTNRRSGFIISVGPGLSDAAAKLRRQLEAFPSRAHVPDFYRGLGGFV